MPSQGHPPSLTTQGKTLSRPHHVELTTAGDLHSIQLEDTSHIKLTLRVLGLWCDGQYDAMQNYLRRQSINIRTMNIVGEVAQFLQNLLQCNEVGHGCGLQAVGGAYAQGITAVMVIALSFLL